MGGRAAVSWIYAGLLIGLPLANLILQTVEVGPWALAHELIKPEAVHSMFLTLMAAFFTVLLNGFFGVCIALTLARQRFRGRAILSIVTDLPMTISPVVAGFLILTLYQSSGWLGRPLSFLGIEIINAFPAIVLASLFVTLPFVTRELTPVLVEIGGDQEEAASTLGAGPWATFWYVTLPSIRHGLFRGLSLTFARTVGEFGAAIVVSGNIIGQTQTLTLWVYQEAGDFNYAGAYAGSLVLGIVSVAMFIVAERLQHRRGFIRDLVPRRA